MLLVGNLESSEYFAFTMSHIIIIIIIIIIIDFYRWVT
jgi:hypothetical protein